MTLLAQKLARLALLLIVCAGCPLAAQSATTINEYAARIQAAAQRVQALSEEEATDAEIARAMDDLRRAFPAREEVTTDGHTSRQTIRVDNSWLHAATEEVSQSAGGDTEQRRNLLVVLKDQLTALRARIEPLLAAPPAATSEQAKLKEILARPEYTPPLKQESTVKRWWQDFWRWVDRQLMRLFGSRRGSVSPDQVSTAATLVRLLLVAILAGAVIYGLIKLTGRRRRTEDEGSDVREVLGERIAEDATAGDLLAEAADLASRGDYRTAIRRTYIALLVELEGRGKLKLQRANTNRDYLQAVKTNEAATANTSASRPVYAAFATMTGTFEHVWYGQERPGQAQFSDYLNEYHETVKQ